MRNQKNQKALAYMQYLRGTGLSNKQIAKKIGCSYSTVLTYIGRTPGWNEKRYSKSLMLNLRAVGMNNSQIAAELKCALQTVNKYIGKTPWQKTTKWDIPDYIPETEQEKERINLTDKRVG